MECPKCGKHNPDDAIFCMYCGTKFPEEQKDDEPWDVSTGGP